jgi:hypothetical protein
MNLMELVVALTTQSDFCHNCQKKMKTPIRFLSQLSKKLKLLYFCHDVDIREVDFYSRS